MAFETQDLDLEYLRYQREQLKEIVLDPLQRIKETTGRCLQRREVHQIKAFLTPEIRNDTLQKVTDGEALISVLDLYYGRDNLRFIERLLTKANCQDLVEMLYEWKTTNNVLDPNLFKGCGYFPLWIKVNNDFSEFSQKRRLILNTLKDVFAIPAIDVDDPELDPLVYMGVSLGKRDVLFCVLVPHCVRQHIKASLQYREVISLLEEACIDGIYFSRRRQMGANMSRNNNTNFNGSQSSISSVNGSLMSDFGQLDDPVFEVTGDGYSVNGYFQASSAHHNIYSEAQHIATYQGNENGMSDRYYDENANKEDFIQEECDGYHGNSVDLYHHGNNDNNGVNYQKHEKEAYKQQHVISGHEYGQREYFSNTKEGVSVPKLVKETYGVVGVAEPEDTKKNHGSTVSEAPERESYGKCFFVDYRKGNNPLISSHPSKSGSEKNDEQIHSSYQSPVEEHVDESGKSPTDFSDSVFFSTEDVSTKDNSLDVSPSKFLPGSVTPREAGSSSIEALNPTIGFIIQEDKFYTNSTQLLFESPSLESTEWSNRVNGEAAGYSEKPRDSWFNEEHMGDFTNKAPQPEPEVWHDALSTTPTGDLDEMSPPVPLRYWNRDEEYSDGTLRDELQHLSRGPSMAMIAEPEHPLSSSQLEKTLQLSRIPGRNMVTMPGQEDSPIASNDLPPYRERGEHQVTPSLYMQYRGDRVSVQEGNPRQSIIFIRDDSDLQFAPQADLEDTVFIDNGASRLDAQGERGSVKFNLSPPPYNPPPGYEDSLKRKSLMSLSASSLDSRGRGSRSPLLSSQSISSIYREKEMFLSSDELQESIRCAEEKEWEKLSEKSRDFLIAAKVGDEKEVNALLDEGIDVNYQNEFGHTALMIASREGNLNVVETLIAAGADLNIQEKFGKSALHEAAWSGQHRVLHCLISGEANINVKDEEKRTPLQYAALRGKRRVVEVLLLFGADVAALNEEGESAVELAYCCGHTDIVGILLSSRDKKTRKEMQGKIRKQKIQRIKSATSLPNLNKAVSLKELARTRSRPDLNKRRACVLQ